MTGEGPSDELQEVEEELVKKKGESNEEDDPVDLEEAIKKNKKSDSFSLGAENLRVFTQVKSWGKVLFIIALTFLLFFFVRHSH